MNSRWLYDFIADRGIMVELWPVNMTTNETRAIAGRSFQVASSLPALSNNLDEFKRLLIGPAQVILKLEQLRLVSGWKRFFSEPHCLVNHRNRMTSS